VLAATCQAAAMPIEIRTPTDDQWLELLHADARGFGFVPEPGDAEQRRPIIDLGRFRVAVDDERIVGVAGSFAMDATMPGGTTVPVSAITWVSVSATHRRQGLLTRLLDACHVDTDDRGEPLAMLFASEGGIYERFGYGIASIMRRVSIERRRVSFRPELQPTPGAVRFLGADAAEDHVAAIWERARRQRAGEVSRSAAWNRFVFELWAKPQGTLSPAFFLGHPDGHAVYRIDEDWTGGTPHHRLEVIELVAVTPQAHLDLWHTILGVDLVATITTRALPVDDALPYLLTDQRAISTTIHADGLWANVRDPAVCFGARAYGTADRLVVEADGRRWAIEFDGENTSCKSVRSRPDLVVDHPSLGALLLGGIRPRQLSAGGRIIARNDAVLARADAFFVCGPAPHCQTYF
jgi:predicted acetyltransferase